MKIIRDMLQIEGRYSLKRVASVLVLIYALILATFIVISDWVLNVEINRYAIEVLEMLILFTGALMGITEFSKKMSNRSGNK